jgi:hypothetical protein
MSDAFRDFLGILSADARQNASEFVASDAADQIATSHRSANYSSKDSQRLPRRDAQFALAGARPMGTPAPTTSGSTAS